MASNSSLLHKPRGEMEWFSIMLQNNGLSSPLHLGEYGFLKHKETKLCHFHSLPVSRNWIFPKLDIEKKSVAHQAEPPILLRFVYLFKMWYWCFYGNVGLKKRNILKTYAWSGFHKSRLNLVGWMSLGEWILFGSKLRLGFDFCFCSGQTFLGMPFWWQIIWPFCLQVMCIHFWGL